MGDLQIVTRRRKWSPEEKAALLAEVEAEGGHVKVVARQHRISESLLYNWRAAWKAAASMQLSEPLEFLPLGVVGPYDGRRDGDTPPIGARISVDVTVNEKALARVLRAMKSTM